MVKEPKRNLYKVKIEVDLCVLAKDSQEAIITAKENAATEITQYGSGLATPLTREIDVPKSWLESVPYIPYGGITDGKTCKQVIREIMSRKNDAQDIDDEDMKQVLKVHEEIAQKVIDAPVKGIMPETKPEPKPKELEWKQPEKKLPQLRF